MNRKLATTASPLALLLTAAALAAASVNCAASTNVLVGAIRWDAWQEGGSIQTAVEKQLAPGQWHYRLPFFATVDATGTNVSCARGNTQAVMDQEINYAANVGIDYWAFVTYPDTYGMTHALHLYLASAYRHRIKFALDLQGGWIATGSENWNTQVARYVNYFTNATYQMVLGNRPLVYLFGGFDSNAYPNTRFPTVAAASNAIVQLRTATTNAGLGSPYIVFQGFNANSDYTILTNYGLDALGAYAVPDGTGTGKTFAAHTTKVHNFWEADKATGAEVVPIVSAGWDSRPRVGNTYLGTGSTNYVLPPTPAEFTNHLGDALDWTRSNLTNASPANAVLIYAWNEHVEGGWICPTLKTNATANAPDTSRLDAIAAVNGLLAANRNWWSIPGAGITILVNQPPTAGDATYTRPAGSGLNLSVADVLAHVTNVSAGQTISLTSVGSGSQGASITLAGAIIQYVPAAGNTNSDSFTYTISDGRGGTATGNITMNVN